MITINVGGPDRPPLVGGVVPICGRRADGSPSCDWPESAHIQNVQKHPARVGISIPGQLVHDLSGLEEENGWDPDWNWGVYLSGNPLCVLDFDDLSNDQTLAILGRSQYLRDHCAVVESNRGFHVYVLLPAVPEETNGVIELVEDGRPRKVGDLKVNGYTVGPGSIHQTGHVYDYVALPSPDGSVWESPRLYELEPVAETTLRAVLAVITQEVGLTPAAFRTGSADAPQFTGTAILVAPEDCPWPLTQTTRIGMRMGVGRKKQDGSVDRSAALYHWGCEIWRERPIAPGEPPDEEFRAVAGLMLWANENTYAKPGWQFDDAWSAAHRAWNDVRAEQGRPAEASQGHAEAAGGPGAANGGQPPVVTFLPPGAAPPPSSQQEFYVAVDSGFLMQRPMRPDGTLGTARKVANFEPVVEEEYRVVSKGEVVDVRYRGRTRVLRGNQWEEGRFEFGARDISDPRTLARVLFRLGGVYSVEPRMHNAVARALTLYDPVGRLQRTVYDQTGWQDENTFVLPGVGAMTPQGNDPMRLVDADWPSALNWYGRAVEYRLGADHAPAWRALLHAHDPHVTVPLALAMLLAPHREAISPTPLLFVHGVTGAGKSTTVSVATSLYGAHDPITNRGVSSYSSAAGIEHLFSLVRHLPLLLDDLKPRASNVEALTSVLQSYGDNAGRTMMNREGGLRREHIPQTLAILTGEDVLLSRSGATVARMVVLDLEPPQGGFGDSTALDMARDGTLAAAGADYLHWCVTRGRSDIARRIGQAQDAAVALISGRGLGNQHARLAANLTTFHVGHALARAYFSERLPAFLPEYEQLAAAALAAMEVSLAEQAIEIAEATVPLGEQILGAIRDACALRQVAFRSTYPTRHPDWHYPSGLTLVDAGGKQLGTQFQSLNGERVTLIGYSDPQGVYVNRTSFYSWWSRRYGREAGDPGWPAVARALMDAGAVRREAIWAEGHSSLRAYLIPWGALAVDALPPASDVVEAVEDIVNPSPGE